ncbi:MAG: hypothetical protein Q8R92_08695 [Deltaproteobacteria bacterium]|nr:hypothetical protein [Deltaproteobacteria bacterium]
MTETETALTKAVKKAAPSKEEGERTSASMEKAVREDPVLMNELGQEPLIQSGVVWTGAIGVITALGTILVQVGRHGDDFAQYDFELLIGAITSLSAAVGVLYRRLMPGLKPLFWRWTSPDA